MARSASSPSASPRSSDATPSRANADPQVIAWFAAASRYLHRSDVRCPEHHVAHTGKLARAIPLDLALLDATGDERYWALAVDRALYVASRLAPDPEHGALIYLPGRLDPRNCSNSVIDSGECTGALAALLAHRRADGLESATRHTLEQAVLQNCDTYLRTAVVEKEITNQRLWGAMGLAAAYRLWPQTEWSEALRVSIRRSLDEQLPDGSWRYQPDAERYGAHAGAADTTVYYHGRCLAFMIAVLEDAPEADPGGAQDALERGLEFLATVTTPDGLKPLALEGKRWFWDSGYEAGSNAYDVFALLRGALRFGQAEWRDLALRDWTQLANHQEQDGGQRAGDPDAADFVCRDFHTSDLAWTARVIAALPSPAAPALAPPPVVASTTYRPDSGILRMEAGGATALVRTAKQPRNSQFGGAVGGGALAYARRSGTPDDLLSIDRDSVEAEGNFVLYSPHVNPTRGLRRFLKDNPLGREGRQWLFVARLLISRGRLWAAARRLCQGYARPLFQALWEPAATHFATTSDVHLAKASVGRPGAIITCQPATADGRVPGWATSVRVERRYSLAQGRTSVQERLTSDSLTARVVYVVPAAAQDLTVAPLVATKVDRRKRRVSVRAHGGPVDVTVSYLL